MNLTEARHFVVQATRNGKSRSAWARDDARVHLHFLTCPASIDELAAHVCYLDSSFPASNSIT
jgi:hypothetical protein